MPITSDRVLVTGISGFLGGHVALQLLKAGYLVRGSVRSLGKSDKVRQTLGAHGADLSRLELVELDLLSDAGWDAAVDGCRYVQHVASPFVIEMPKDRNELIRPAVEGTRRGLEASLRAGVERVVLTSSIAAIAYGHEAEPERVYTEADWTNLKSPTVPAYQESKTRAEQEAWRIMDAQGARSRLAVINPAAIFGPLLDSDPGTSGQIVLRLLDGSMPGAPKMSMPSVDVRDVAAAQLAAMTDPGAGGHRFILSDSEITLFQAGEALRTGLDRPGLRTPRFELPNWLVRFAGLFDRQIRDNAAELGRTKRLDGNSGRTLIGRSTIPATEAVLATARSAIAHGLIKA